MGYFSRTGTKRNLDAMRRCGWGILICASPRPGSDHRDEGFTRVMLDNGAWKCRKEADQLGAWRDQYEHSFGLLLDRWGESSDLIVVPDIVAGGKASLELSLSWLPRLRGLGGLLLPVQDGMSAEDIEPLLGPELGIFVGGSDDPKAPGGGWKWNSLAEVWGPLAQRTGCHLHVGRAGSYRQISRCVAAGAHSFDSTQTTRCASKAPGMQNARLQLPLIGTS